MMAVHPRVRLATLCCLWGISTALLLACIPLFVALNANGFVWSWPFSTYPAIKYNLTFEAAATCLEGLSWLAFSTLGTLIVLRYPVHRIGWTYSMIGLLGAAELFSALYSWQLTYASPPGAMTIAWVNNWVWVLKYGLLGVYLLLLFPSGRLANNRWQIVGWLTGVSMAVILLIAAFHVGPLYNGVERLKIENPFAVTGFATVAIDWLEKGSFVLLNLSLLAATISLFYRLRHTGDEERLPLKWLAYFTAILALLLVSQALIDVILGIESLLFEIAYALLWDIVVISLPIATGLAILKHRLWDIDLIVNRTFVYGGLTGAIIIVYVLSVGAMSLLFQTQDNLLISLFATGLVAVGIQPLRDHLQHAVNRLMFGQRDEPLKMLSELAHRLEAAETPPAILATLVQSIATALHLPYVALWLQSDDVQFVPTAAWGEQPPQLIFMPLVYQQQEIGRLAVAPRSPQENFSSGDETLLISLTQLVAATVRAVQLNTELQRSRGNLVMAREEERRRIRRDLHDELAPTLAGLSLTASTISDLIPNDPTKAAVLANKLYTSIRAAVGDIRHLVYDLRPPTLDELGLVAAIRERAAQYNDSNDTNDSLHVLVEAPPQLPPLSAAVEVAAYRITQEAFMNVVRHAGAHECHIRLACTDALYLEISDDGVGLAARQTTGVGLRSMRERAAELGGFCAIESRLAGGTRIFVRLPISKEVTNEPAAYPDR